MSAPRDPYTWRQVFRMAAAMPRIWWLSERGIRAIRRGDHDRGWAMFAKADRLAIAAEFPNTPGAR